MSDLQCAATLLVARDGEAAYETDLVSTDGGSLTARGRGQATRLADAVRSRRVATIWTSPMVRAVQTAEIAAASLGCADVRVREALREYASGYVGDKAGSVVAFAEMFTAWDDGELDRGFPGGETGAQLVRRVHDVLGEIADLHRGEGALVITHGVVMSVALPRLAVNLPDRWPTDGDPANGDLVELVEVVADADGWVCRSWAVASLDRAFD